MSRPETKRKIKALKKALKLNNNVLRYSPSPHERDTAKWRITLIKSKIRGYTERLKGDC